MKLTFRLNKEQAAALLLLLLGPAIVIGGLDYRAGTLLRMGAGFMPVVYGVLLALIGTALSIGAGADSGINAGAEAGKRDSASSGTQWRAWICILGGVAAFAVFGYYGGLVPATFAAVTISALGDRDNSLRDAVLLATCLVLVAVTVFSYALRLQLPLFSWG